MLRSSALLIQLRWCSANFRFLTGFASFDKTFTSLIKLIQLYFLVFSPINSTMRILLLIIILIIYHAAFIFSEIYKYCDQLFRFFHQNKCNITFLELVIRIIFNEISFRYVKFKQLYSD